MLCYMPMEFVVSVFVFVGFLFFPFLLCACRNRDRLYDPYSLC